MALGVCLSLAAALQAPPVFVPVTRFTLAWTHSIERVRWEEDYAVLANPQRPGHPRLLALRARVRGSGAGMEPPSDAKLRDGWYEYTPDFTSPAQLRLTRSEFTPDYDWCTEQGCQALATLLASDGGVTLLEPCQPP